MGYREIEHTADWAMEVWAEDIPGLFMEAAAGMVALQGICFLESGSARPCEMEFNGVDYESLLVSFLSELLFLQESEQLGSRIVRVLELNSEKLLVFLQLESITIIEKAVKAVTYHDLAIKFSHGNWSTRIVMDV